MTARPTCCKDLPPVSAQAVHGCVECGAPWETKSIEWTSLVGFSSPEGHDHDDNCTTSEYTCTNGHRRRLSIRRRCSACEWVGKENCRCHPGPKVDEWPVAARDLGTEYLKAKQLALGINEGKP